ncbi:alcohol dehydrogenase/L-iditol 2-dehydrogenase [Lipingzhangella halophila]|uniref:Alcohol dehydrogenase/L-iditol 2-dehydrogenase n=1 Tax=Lipingzhangella halophila TaxID=1783352 RepID=A0A7W7W2M1_9ACTN|nr:alcohol dehydrogenase catalytic domain-containing protein [Lipingzhangella halophila]MBB4931588.1 alcohol dehydrogenase/L-iditol 2-dehydrogenase [Lipingzhangella halophila]
MRAIVLTEPQRVEVVEEWPEPVAGPHDVIVAVRGVGLCGSDLSVYDGNRAVPSSPWVMGHEGGGEIVAVGSRVTDRRVGQRVAIEPNYCCFECPPCRAGHTSACTRREIVGMNTPGLLAERVAVPARFTWPVPEHVADESLACVEPLAVARAAVRRSGAAAGDRCLVVGAGSQGLLLCQALVEAGAEVRVTEPHEGRLALAETLGAKRADLDRGDEYLLAFDTTGAPQGWQTTMEALARTGTAIVIGMTADPVPLSTRDLVQRQMSVRGVLIYDHPDDFRDTVAAVASGALLPARTLQAGFAPREAATAFARARTAPGKSWINMAVWQEGSQ